MFYRSWLEAASNEHSMRGPVCFVRDYSVYSQVVHQIRDLYIKPRIGILFMPRNTKGIINLEGIFILFIFMLKLLKLIFFILFFKDISIKYFLQIAKS